FDDGRLVAPHTLHLAVLGSQAWESVIHVFRNRAVTRVGYAISKFLHRLELQVGNRVIRFDELSSKTPGAVARALVENVVERGLASGREAHSAHHRDDPIGTRIEVEFRAEFKVAEVGAIEIMRSFVALFDKNLVDKKVGAEIGRAEFFQSFFEL